MDRQKRRFWYPRNWLGEIVPASWLRYAVTWRALNWIHARYHVCWASMVSWKLGYDESDWRVKPRSCWEPYDYCGYYDDPAKAAERAEALAMDEPEVLLTFQRPGEE